jgi:hypothetical protein
MSTHGGAGGGGGTSLLARVQYVPSLEDTYSTTSQTVAVVDATNLTVSFKAPASGDVLIRLTGTVEVTGTYEYWALLDHTSSAQRGSTATVAGANDAANAVTAVFLLTGLTPNTTYQVDWAFAAASGSTAYLIVQGATGIPSQANAGPATMEVWSA